MLFPSLQQATNVVSQWKSDAKNEWFKIQTLESATFLSFYILIASKDAGVGVEDPLTMHAFHFCPNRLVASKSMRWWEVAWLRVAV